MSESRKGIVWWNNGTESVMNRTQPGHGWVLGKLKATCTPRSTEYCAKRAENQKGKVFWNNGVINTISRECPGNGWVRGRITSLKEKESYKTRNKKRNFK
jgi:hypothetical protein